LSKSWGRFCWPTTEKNCYSSWRRAPAKDQLRVPRSL